LETLGFKKRPRQLRLANYGHEGSGAEFGMIRDRDSNRRIFYSFLHYDVATSLADFRKALTGEDGANFATRQNT
jgi:hypothetical protein